MFKAPCPQLCGKPLKRLHFSCSFCRIRRWASGEIRPPAYMKGDLSLSVKYRQGGRFTIPTNSTVYLLIIDRSRKHDRTKAFISRILLTLAEALSN